MEITTAVMCVALAIWGEARNQNLEGQEHVIDVIVSRVDSPHYPDTVCGVVFQSKVKNGEVYHQFSFLNKVAALDMEMPMIAKSKIWNKMVKVAEDVLVHKKRKTKPIKSLCYYATWAEAPDWALPEYFIKVQQDHAFYERC